MTWYAAHLIFYVKLKHKRQTRYPVWENIVLISARTLDEAFEKAEKRAMEDPCMDPDDTFTWGGTPAEWVYAGMRKLTLCVDEDKRPLHGTELTYIEYELPSKEAVRKLAEGETVSLKMIDPFPDDEADDVVETHAAVANGRKSLSDV